MVGPKKLDVCQNSTYPTEIIVHILWITVRQKVGMILENQNYQNISLQKMCSIFYLKNSYSLCHRLVSFTI